MEGMTALGEFKSIDPERVRPYVAEWGKSYDRLISPTPGTRGQVSVGNLTAFALRQRERLGRITTASQLVFRGGEQFDDIFRVIQADTKRYGRLLDSLEGAIGSQGTEFRDGVFHTVPVTRGDRVGSAYRALERFLLRTDRLQTVAAKDPVMWFDLLNRVRYLYPERAIVVGLLMLLGVGTAIALSRHSMHKEGPIPAAKDAKRS